MKSARAAQVFRRRIVLASHIDGEIPWDCLVDRSNTERNQRLNDIGDI